MSYAFEAAAVESRCNTLFRVVRTTVCVLLAAIAAPSWAFLIVAPNFLAGVDANGSDAFPFAVQFSRIRYQEIFAASEFSSLGGAQLLNGISLRADQSTPNYLVTINHVTLRVSTTSRPVSGLSNGFDVNHGPNLTTVFDRALTISHAWQPGYPASQPFDLTIPFDVPFDYNPSAGNLLLDYIVETGASSGGPLDSVFFGGPDTIARLYQYLSVPGSAAGYGIGQGLVTQFSFASVPEPNAIALLAFGGALLCYVRRKRLTGVPG
jgi:hypothetical protein